MTVYPGAIDTFRTTQNLPGIVYDAAQTKTIFAEDINGHSAAIAAIETELGTNPKNTATNVSERLDLMSAAIITAMNDAAEALAAAEARKTPVNGVFISLSSTNPGTSLGYGTWVLTAEGCAVVGYKSGDADFGAVGTVVGGKTVDSSHQHDTAFGWDGSSFFSEDTSTVSGAPIFGSEVSTVARATFARGARSSAGSRSAYTKTAGDSTMSIIQESMAFYIWKRTA